MAELQLDQVELALPHFDRTEGSTTDPDLIYLARLGRGVAFMGRERWTDSESAFRAALAAVPRAASATVGLTWLLYVTGRHQDAAALAAGQFVPGPRPDPWLDYDQADARLWPVFVAHLRTLIRR